MTNKTKTLFVIAGLITLLIIALLAKRNPVMAIVKKLVRSIVRLR